MNPDDLKIIQQQVPEISIEQIEKVYHSCQQDVFETICQLLELPKPKEKILSEWEERRDICDTYDKEMQTLMNEMKQSGLQEEPLTNIPITKKPKLT
jgi:hypothetical protein